MILAIYANTFNASWHLDDFSNITANTKIQLTELTPASIYGSFFANPKKSQLYRPVPMMTLALNWYVGQNDPVGYHAVNILIHCLTAYLIFLVSRLLLRTPRIGLSNDNDIYFISLLTAALWAINPIQIQAVTYIVQRMASMAAMFYILGIYLYLKFRFETRRTQKGMWILLCFLSLLLGLGSKQNAALLPVAVILVEFGFFQNLGDKKTKNVFLITFFVIFLAVLGLGTLIFLKDGNPLSFLKGYQNRSFTPLERLMTEPRVLVFHLSQIFYPIPGRFSIEHMIPVSTSLFHPWTTLPSILTVFGLIGFAIAQLSKRTLLSFAILFFFLNHLLESSIIGLELVFEHRNYLPSAFLFLPVAYGLNAVIKHYRHKKAAIYIPILLFIPLIMITVGMGTYTRNHDWRTEKTLWEYALKNAPNSGRALHNLAWGHYEKIGEPEKAMELYYAGLDLEGHSIYHLAITLNNIAGLYFDKKMIEKAIETWDQAIANYPSFHSAQMRKAMALAMLGRFNEAVPIIDSLLAQRDLVNMLNLRGFIALKQGKYSEAISFLRRALKQQPNHFVAMRNLGAVFMQLEDYPRAMWYLRRVHAGLKNDNATLLLLLETSLRMDDKKRADRYLTTLFALNGDKKIFNLLKESRKDLSLPISTDVVSPAIYQKMKNNADKKASIADEVMALSQPESQQNDE